MARPLRVFTLLSRLGALSLSARSCRFAGRDATAWTAQSLAHRASGRAPRQSHHEMFEEDADMEDVEDKLQAVVFEERKKQRTVKYHVIRRKMTPAGAPERKLTWDAMQQIRYLKQEQPEEWTVERLATSFSVTPDVIRRVLRSKFIPAPERKAKMDAKVMARLGQQALPAGGGAGQDKPRLPGHSTAAVLPAGCRAGELVPVAMQTLVPGGKGSGSLAATLPTQLSVSPAGVGDHSSATTRSTEDDARATKYDAVEEEEEVDEEEEGWDGQVFSENELEELMPTAKPSPVVRDGNDVFDAEGHFLYRL